jgi:hypothetical protein
MRFIRCGSKLFDPRAVTAVHLDRVPTSTSQSEVWVVVPGDILVFRGDEARAVREFFSRIPATDLLRQHESEATGIFGERIPARDDEPTEAVAANHNEREC